MASGHHHDRATVLLALPFGLLCGAVVDSSATVPAAGAFLVGGLWLSPDLDVRSNALRRWGPLAALWGPYRRCLRHRSLLSHGPLVGTAGRLAYLGAWVLLLALVAQPLGAPPPPQLLERAADLWRQHRAATLAVLAGLEASAWLHLLQDGDPPLRLPRPRRRRRTRPGMRA